MRTTLFFTLAYIGYVGQMYVENRFGIQLLDIPAWVMLVTLALAFTTDIKDLSSSTN